jgi:hypothetical protein
MVFVVDLDVVGVFPSDRDFSHGLRLSWSMRCRYRIPPVSQTPGVSGR